MSNISYSTDVVYLCNRIYAERKPKRMNTYETLKNLVREVGLVAVLSEMENLVTDFESKHGYRRDFCKLTVSLIGVIVEAIRGFEAKYGYTAGKEA